MIEPQIVDSVEIDIDNNIQIAIVGNSPYAYTGPRIVEVRAYKNGEKVAWLISKDIEVRRPQ